MLLPCALLVGFLRLPSFIVLVHNFLRQGIYFNDKGIHGVAQTGFEVLLSTFVISITLISNSNNQTETSSLENLKQFPQVLSKTKKVISTDLTEQKGICDNTQYRLSSSDICIPTVELYDLVEVAVARTGFSKAVDFRGMIVDSLCVYINLFYLLHSYYLYICVYILVL